MGSVVLSCFDSDVYHEDVKRPLLLSSSGGGGHLSAIHGIKSYLISTYQDQLELPLYHPIPIEAKNQYINNVSEQIDTFLSWLHEKGLLSDLIKKLVKHSMIPIIPTRDEINTEVSHLLSKNKPEIQRQYIDMLLDICPGGYQSAAIANVLAQKDNVNELRKLIPYQKESDEHSFDAVYSYFLSHLKRAALVNKPYTEIISTQVMGLKAVTHAVIAYNQWLDKALSTFNYPKLIIHQYMTDLPTKGAVHFSKPLNYLGTLEKKQIKLYACALSDGFIRHHLTSPASYAGLYSIPISENPMVRPGFTNPLTSLHDKFEESCAIEYLDYEISSLKKTESPSSLTIKETDIVASIMLGSQASDDTIQYIKKLLLEHVDYIFVFGGLNPRISSKIDAFISEFNAFSREKTSKRIIKLGYQTDIEMQPIFTRSNIVIIRGGGLSIMEQMAIPHAKQQAILFHHTNLPQTDFFNTIKGFTKNPFALDKKRVNRSLSLFNQAEHPALSNPTPPPYFESTLTSGISWEDENVNDILLFLKKNHVFARKTSPDIVETHINKVLLSSYFAPHVSDEMKLKLLQLSNYRLQYLIKTHPPSPLLLEFYFSVNTKTQNHLINILTSLDPILLNKLFIEKLISNKKNIQAISKLTTAGELSPSMLTDILDNESIKNTIFKSRFSENILYVWLTPTKNHAFQLLNIESTIHIIDIFYNTLSNTKGKDPLLKFTTATHLKAKFFTLICQKYPSHQFYQSLLASKLKHKEKIKLDYLAYQCAQLKSQFLNTHHSAKTLLLDIMHLIEDTPFKTCEFGGDTIYFKTQTGESFKNVVPHHLRLIYDELKEINISTNSPNIHRRIQKIESILIRKMQSKAREEYTFFKTALAPLFDDPSYSLANKVI